MRWLIAGERGWMMAWALLFAAGTQSALSLQAVANGPLVTNLLQPRHAVAEHSHSTVRVRLEGTVCEVNGRRGILILRDASGVESLELEALPDAVPPGRKSRLSAEACEVIRRRTGILSPALKFLGCDGRWRILPDFAQ